MLTFLTLAAWIAAGYAGGTFIIRWNERHLSAADPPFEKLAIADKLNAILPLRDAPRWSIMAMLVLFAPITIPKAALLRVLGGSAAR